MNLKSYKFIEYTVLIIGAAIFFFLFWLFRYQHLTLIKLTGLAAVFYTLWGVLHHLVEKRLTFEIALEYVLISIFIFMLVFTALSV